MVLTKGLSISFCVFCVCSKPKVKERRERKLVADDGRILNVNEAK